MSFYDDYVADGACCQCCGAYMGSEPGYARICDGCKPKPEKKAKAKRSKVTA
jgi:hypothetical protein